MSTETPEIFRTPEPASLEEARQRHVRDKFIGRVGSPVLAVVLYLNLVGGLMGALMFGRGPFAAFAIAGLLGGLPLLGLIGLNRYVQRHERAARTAIRERFGIDSATRWLRTAVGLVFVALGALAVFVGLQDHARVTVVLLFFVLGLLGPIVRRGNQPDFPPWAMGVLGGWIAAAGLWVLALSPWLQADRGFFVGLLWILCAPFAVPTFLVRNRLVDWARRDDGLGSVARWLATFVPPAQSARLKRESGDVQGSLRALLHNFSRPIARQFLRDALIELGETLVASGDERALPVLSAAARVLPADPRPFVGLARVFREDDLERALAYARFAEENAARQLRGGDPEVSALREALEAD